MAMTIPPAKIPFLSKFIDFVKRFGAKAEVSEVDRIIVTRMGDVYSGAATGVSRNAGKKYMIGLKEGVDKEMGPAETDTVKVDGFINGILSTQTVYFDKQESNAHLSFDIKELAIAYDEYCILSDALKDVGDRAFLEVSNWGISGNTPVDFVVGKAQDKVVQVPIPNLRYNSGNGEDSISHDNLFRTIPKKMVYTWFRVLHKVFQTEKIAVSNIFDEGFHIELLLATGDVDKFYDATQSGVDDKFLLLFKNDSGTKIGGYSGKIPKVNEPTPKIKNEKITTESRYNDMLTENKAAGKFPLFVSGNFRPGSPQNVGKYNLSLGEGIVSATAATAPTAAPLAPVKKTTTTLREILYNEEYFRPCPMKFNKDVLQVMENGYPKKNELIVAVQPIGIDSRVVEKNSDPTNNTDFVGIKVRTRNGRRNDLGKIDRDAVKKSVKDAYRVLKKSFTFQNEDVLRATMCIWLMNKGAGILWGIPGTGKTTLIEAMSFLMCDDLDFSTQKIRSDVIDTYIKSPHGNLGVANYNPSKSPHDIFYTTAIEIEHMGIRKNPSPSDPLVVVPSPEVPPVTSSIPTVVPIVPGAITEAQREADKLVRVGREVYDIRPQPRPIVTAPVKFHNEFNRSSGVVQDSMLRLLSEGEIEQSGLVFKSKPALHIFDANKYVLQDNPVDEALMDRIDISVTVPNIMPSKRAEMLESAYCVGLTDDVRTNIANSINSVLPDGSRDVVPICYEELQEIWKMVSEIRFTMKTVHRIVVLLSYFSEGVAEFTGGVDKWASELGHKETMKTKFGDVEWFRNIDFGDVTFKDSLKNPLNGMNKAVEKAQGASGLYMAKFIHGLKKQLGHRVYRSLPRFLQAWRFLEHCLDPSVALVNMVDEEQDDGQGGKKKVMVNAGIELPLEFISEKVKYVGSHRMKMEVSSDISANLLSVDQVFDYFSESVVPDRSERWDVALDVGYHVYGMYAAVGGLQDESKLQEAIEQFDELLLNPDPNVQGSGFFNGQESVYTDELKGHVEGTHEMRTVRQIIETLLGTLVAKKS